MNRVGLIGKGIEYSFSPTFFSEKWYREGIQNWSYDLFDLSSFPENLLTWWKQQPHLIGANVTIPYKQDAYRAVEAQNLSDSAKAIKAINTVVFDPQIMALRADNTDWRGFLGALDQEQVLGTGKPALILGTGGSSAAIAYALKSIGVDFAKVSRQEKEGNITYSDLKGQLKEYGLIVNTTPLGGPNFLDDYPPLPFDEVVEQHYYFDLNYGAGLSKAMQMCSLRGAYVQNGSEMLIRQAEFAWDFWRKWYQ